MVGPRAAATGPRGTRPGGVGRLRAADDEDVVRATADLLRAVLARAWSARLVRGLASDYRQPRAGLQTRARQRRAYSVGLGLCRAAPRADSPCIRGPGITLAPASVQVPSRSGRSSNVLTKQSARPSNRRVPAIRAPVGMRRQQPSSGGAPATGTSAELCLQTFASFADARAIAPEWDALITELSGSLYQTFSWCQVWWRHYGDGRELRLMCVRSGTELVGVLPFFIDKLRVPFGRARVAKLAGSDSTVALVEPLVHTRVAIEALALAMRQLFEDDRVDAVHFGPVSETAAHLAAIRRSTEIVTGVARVIRDRVSGSHTVFTMPDGFDAYMRTLSKNSRSNYRRNLNKINAAFSFAVDVVREPLLLGPEFEAFVEMHQAQWRAVGRRGHFDDWPASRAFSRDLVRTLAAGDQVRLIRLLVDGQVVAYYWCFALNGTYYWRLPARVSGEQWDQFALGRIGLVKMMEVAAAEGVTLVEAGVGRYLYKEKLNARTSPVHSVVLCRRGLAPRLRAHLTLATGAMLSLVYYRMWYLRIGPRLRILRGPLRRCWIRRRF